MAARRRRPAKRANNGGAQPGNGQEQQREPQTVVVIRVRDNAGVDQYVGDAELEGDYVAELTDAHRFLLEDARPIAQQLRGEHADVSLCAVGHEGNTEHGTTHRQVAEA